MSDDDQQEDTSPAAEVEPDNTVKQVLTPRFVLPTQPSLGCCPIR